MNIENIEMGDVFLENIKEYQSRPVKAAKYLPGMENAFTVCFTNFADEGFRFFDDLESAMRFYDDKPKQERYVDGAVVTVDCYYHEPAPVLIRRRTEEEKKASDSEGFAAQSLFCNNEINDYEVIFLSDGCWIIQESDGSIRVWTADLEETFFGDEIYEKIAGKEEYVKVAI